jgi:glycosyltransferase involved in cell wall biosynthesis
MGLVRAGRTGESLRTWPRVTVVMPVHNTREWIGEALASVVAQQYPRDCLEIIVVDDGSSDGSARVAQQVLGCSKILHRVFRTENGGPSRARNLGWRAGSGEWVQFLDSDDLLALTKISTQMEVARCLPAEVAVVYSPWQRLGYMDGAWRPLGLVVSPKLGQDVVGDLLRTETFVPTGSHLVRRSWLEETGGYDERCWLIEDVDFQLRIGMAGGVFSFVRSETPLSFYRMRGDGSLSRRDAKAFVAGCQRNAEMVERCWRLRGTLTPVRAAILADAYFYVARNLASTDEQEYTRVVAKMVELVPKYLPPGPLRLRLLSRLIGYRKAERVAGVYRATKRRLDRQRWNWLGCKGK